MKYGILGAGGIGGAIGGFLAAAGYDVTLLARGKHYEAIKEKGLVIHSGLKGEMHLPNINVSTVEDYDDDPDVLFVTVKGYSVKELLPFLKRFAGTPTVVIPLLNIYGTGAYLQKMLPRLNVITGCIYILAHISAPGEITQEAKIFRIVMGTDGTDSKWGLLEQIEVELRKAGIKVVLSDHISVDAFRKFAFISPYAATGALFDYNAGEIRNSDAAKAIFERLVLECKAIGEAMGLALPKGLLEESLITLDAMGETSTASMQKDIALGKKSEVDGLVYQLVKWGEEYNVPTPTYNYVAAKLSSKL